MITGRRARRGGAAGHRRQGGRARELAPPRLPAVDARHPSDRGAREQDGPGRLRPRASSTRIEARVPRVPGRHRRATRARSFRSSGRDGDNIATPSPTMPWYDGPTVLEALDAFRGRARRAPTSRSACRCRTSTSSPSSGDDRRIVAGTVEAGRRSVGDEVVFYPSGKRAEIKSVEAFNRRRRTAICGRARRPGSRSHEQIYVARGEVATLSRRAAARGEHAAAREPVLAGQRPARQEEGLSAQARHGACDDAGRGDPSRHRRLDSGRPPERSDAGRAARSRRVHARVPAGDRVRPGRRDRGDQPLRHRRRLRDQRRRDRPRGAAGRAGRVREQVLLRELQVGAELHRAERRAARFAQRPTLLLITGAQGRRPEERLARALEARLFDEGRAVYFLGIGNVLYGVDADIARGRENRHEHVRRLAEVANLMLDAGMILIVTARSSRRRTSS